MASAGCWLRSLRHLGHRAVRALHGVEHEEAVELGGPGLRADGTAAVARARGLDQPAAQLGVAQLPPLLVERQGAQLLPHGETVEGELGLEREQGAQPAAVDLGEHAPAQGRRLVEQGQVLAPDVGAVAPAEHAEGDGPPRLHGQVAQPEVILAQTGIAGGAVHALAGQLEDARVQLAHDADEAPHLVPGGRAARHGPAVGRLVGRRARGGEADGAGAQGVAQLALHRLEVVLGGRLIEGALAHHVGAQGGVADVAGVVDALGQRLEGVEELRVGGPLPLDARLHGLGRRCPRRAAGCARPCACRLPRRGPG